MDLATSTRTRTATVSSESDEHLPLPHSFILTDGHHTCYATGTATVWPDVRQAINALPGAGMVLGAIPFHETDAPALFTPDHYWFSHGAPHLPSGRVATATAQREVPSIQDHARRVESFVHRIKNNEFKKIVASRSVTYQMDGPTDPEALLAQFLAGSGTGHGHLVNLSSAGPEYNGAYLIGSSPELLIAKRGKYIESYPLAGTVGRSIDPVQDQARATALMLSSKDIGEHKYVTDEIRRILQPYCTELHVPESPSLTSTSHTWHLGTRIVGTLKDPNVSALELAVALHPTPAVGGYPTATARSVLAEEEPWRGFYAGAAGWSDEAGNGEWRVVIRSAVLQDDTVQACAGGGIVAQSNPEEEVNETIVKLGPARSALGISLGIKGK